MLDLTNLKFNKLTAIKQIGKDKHKNNIWLFKCDCGKETQVTATLVKSGSTKSCGCLQYESRNIKHGKSYSRIYNIWCNMMTRCYNKKSKSYKQYGEKGVYVSTEWHEFEKFYEDTKDNYSDNLTLDRIDPNGIYDSTNFKWSTVKEQGRNKRDTKFYEYNGKLRCVPEIAELLEVSKYVLYGKLAYGWSLEEAISRIKNNK